jgi:hypothetical protein
MRSVVRVRRAFSIISQGAHDRHEPTQTIEAREGHPRPAGSRFPHCRLGVDEIAATEWLTPKRTESILRQELRNRWVAPAEDFARLQIARLEQMILKLLERLQNGDLKAIDRALKIVDRLDRYHGFTKAKRIPEQYGDEERARLLKKVNEIADRLQPEHPAE